jgi:hypothetical protein
MRIVPMMNTQTSLVARTISERVVHNFASFIFSKCQRKYQQGQHKLNMDMLLSPSSPRKTSNHLQSLLALHLTTL